MCFRSSSDVQEKYPPPRRSKKRQDYDSYIRDFQKSQERRSSYTKRDKSSSGRGTTYTNPVCSLGGGAASGCAGSGGGGGC
ncbi:uncharacterized protein N7498_008147 [Penicillium cinerascens]|uniref:Uncharacterized protein n=1 Tax=Penicillium cinerascens TaxID=70096 RepID=A0A9W9MAI0_9EURO|nr:uncharacterized protein N7498_008147 [Penicillium cinerascens]KAJ5194709.1 hypothetical protein N7498_008147 [Penicillium cinerascens]